MISKIKNHIGCIRRRLLGRLDLLRILHTENAQGLNGLSRPTWVRSLSDPTTFYECCVRYFFTALEKEYRSHREYFRDTGRGFGEDAFHVLWFLLCREFRPGSFLEIGVFRGQTLSLVSLMSKRLGFRCEVAGISPFLPAGDSVSNYRSDIDYFADTQSNFSHFGLRSPGLCRAFSTDPEASEFAASRQWDCIYIDGNHDYSVASSDWQLCCKLLSTNGIIVLDDSALETSYRPPAFATAGHPGPSRLAKEIQSSQPQFSEILRVGHNRVFQHLG